VLREVSPATFSVSIETEATFLLFQLGLVGRAIVFSMSASCSSARRPALEAERRNIFAQLLVSERLDKHVRGRIERLASPDRTISSVLIGTKPGFRSQLKPDKSIGIVSSPTLKLKSKSTAADCDRIQSYRVLE
jgi:hypothetical protein